MFTVLYGEGTFMGVSLGATVLSYLKIARVYYVLCIAFGLLAFIPERVMSLLPRSVPVLRNILNNSVGRGKTYDERSAKELGRGSFLISRLLSASVPKKWFAHLYHVAVFNTFLHLCLLCLSLACQPEATTVGKLLGTVEHRNTLLALACLQIHVSRRLYENYFVHVHSEEGRMQLVGYVFGLLYYVFLPATFYTETVAGNTSSILDASGALSSTCDLNWSSWWLGDFVGTVKGTDIALLALFFFGNVMQYQSHAMLASLRSKGGRGSGEGKRTYKIPKGFWFTYCSNPHYLAEIVLYLAFITLSNSWSQSTVILMTMVVMNLTLSATMTHKYYKEKFKTYPTKRYAIFPGIV